MVATVPPLALIGYPAAAARALQALDLLALTVPTDNLNEVLAACQTLGFSGALVAQSHEFSVAEVVAGDTTAKKTKRVDAVAFALKAHGTFAFADALSDTLEHSGYSSRGASAVFIGYSAEDMMTALPLARLGFSIVGIVAESVSEAERIAREVPAGIQTYAMSLGDRAIHSLTERADLIVLTAGKIPANVIQPYHAFIDLTGQARKAVQTNGASTIDLSQLPVFHLMRQLEHATGKRFSLEQVAKLLTDLG